LVTVPDVTQNVVFCPSQLVTVPDVTQNVVFSAPYVKQCQEGDPNLVGCIVASLHHLRPYLAEGNNNTLHGKGRERKRSSPPSNRAFYPDILIFSLTV